ncbi:MAG TPA: FHIPEP family type III secretion protein, partial [Candidatus Ozemobacteraceae bacterium]|nr:FHIPEP family type III secretion protein [Candidatus Ozemobacteraceae bacterium]
MAENRTSTLMNSVAMVEVLKNRDVLFAIGLVSVIMMMFIPLPAFFLDIMLALNIALALTILLVSVYTKDALEFSIFPSLLLLATVFRLGLNVSTTRLILLGEGAKITIVKSFGSFVVGGNYVVGAVMFAIIVVFLFVVVTKGSERVAEVAARFTLDAMPGKQMAIDADLNAGVIDNDEARKRRRNVQREADFYGAMDGASKFVKGDAIAGIIIIIINILGGFVIGVLMR